MGAALDIAGGLQRLQAAGRTARALRTAALPVPIVSVSANRGVVRGLRWPMMRLKGLAADELRDMGVDFIRRHPELFGEPALDRVATVSAGDDAHGGLSIVVQQYHGTRRARVRGGAARFHADREGTVDALENRLFLDLAEVPPEPRVTERDALAIARAALARESPPIRSLESMAREAELLVVSYQERAYLAWQIWLREDRPYDDRVFVVHVDAANGTILDWYDDTQEGVPAQGTGRGHYTDRVLQLHTWREAPDRFELRDVTRDPVVIVTSVEEGGGARVSTSADNDWTAAVRRAEADAHYFAGIVVDYFRARGGRHRKLGQAGKIHIHVHAPVTSVGGKWDTAARVVRLSDGDGETWGPCSSLDWVAHELVHSYTQATCDLTYRGESGAISEAISDTFTAFIRDDVARSGAADNWGRFKESWRGRNPRAPYRNMVDPHNGGIWSSSPQKALQAMQRGCGPHHVDEMFRGGADADRLDHGGVHINSSILNHMFHLLAKGGTHKTSRIKVEPIGNQMLEDLLFRCMEYNLPVDPNCDFRGFRRHMVDACLVLFPGNLVILERLKFAFRAVGIGPDLIIRDNPRDEGSKPVPAAGAQKSPDVINRRAAVDRPSTALGDERRDDLSEDIRAAADNYVYVRVRNRGIGISDASISVFLAAAAEAENPAAWQPVPGEGTSGIVTLAIKQDEFRVVGPFVLAADRTPPAGDYCLIAVVSSAFDPVPPYQQTLAASDYLAYLRNTNNVAARKLKVRSAA